MAKQSFVTGQVLTADQMTSLQQTAMGGGAATAKTASYVLVATDAGATVAMNAAGATTITVNTGLFAAGDTVFIQNLGAGACTVTAGTATVATAGSLILPQNDAGILYFTSASAAIFYDYIQVGATSPLTTKGDLYTFGTSDDRLPVGPNLSILVADSSEATGLKWAAPAGGGSGMTLLSTTTLSGTSTTVSAIDQTYKNLFIEVANATWDTADDSPAFVTNISGAVYSVKNLGPTSVTTRSLLTTVTEIDDVNQSAKRTGANNYYAFTFNDYASTANPKSFTIMGSYEGSAISRIAALFGSIASNTAMSEFTFSLTNNRNMTAGTIRVYGVK